METIECKLLTTRRKLLNADVMFRMSYSLSKVWPANTPYDEVHLNHYIFHEFETEKPGRPIINFAKLRSLTTPTPAAPSIT